MTKIRSTMVALAIAATAVAAGTAGAQSTAPAAGQQRGHVKGDSAKWAARGGSRGRAKHAGKAGRGGMLRGVNVTDAQRAQIKAIHEKYKPQFESFRTAEKPTVEEAKAARQRGDTAAARAAWAKSEGTRAQARALRDQENAEIRAVLTAEQQATFDANLAQEKTRMDARGEGKGRGHGKGRGRARGAGMR